MTTNTKLPCGAITDVIIRAYYGAKERKPQHLTPPRKYRKGPWKCSER